MIFADTLNTPGWLHEFGPDVAAFVVSALMVGAYYLYLARQSRRNPTFTIHAVNELARGRWVEHIMSNPAKDIVGVQTLRNFVMGASLMASTATVLIIGTLTLSGQADNIARSWHVLNPGGSHAPVIWMFRVLCLLLDFIISFFAFALAVRLANQVVFMLNVPPSDDRPPALAPEHVARRMIRAGNMFAIGLRAFFFAVPLVFWLFGPILLVVATAGLVLVLYQVDRFDAND